MAGRLSGRIKQSTNPTKESKEERKVDEQPFSHFGQSQKSQNIMSKKRPVMQHSIVAPGLKKRKAEGAKFKNREV